MQAKTSYWLVAVAVIALTTLALLPSASTTTLAGGTIAPINSRPNGATYGQWGARWWQWAFSFPVHNPPCTGKPCTNDLYNPLFVNGAADCSLGQTGHVWFIGGVFLDSGAATRTCTIPSGTALFFPVLNAWVDNVGNDPLWSEAQLRAAAAGLVQASELHAKIDGTDVGNLFSYRAKSPLFTLTIPPVDNVYQWSFEADVPGALWPDTTVEGAVSDGYWLFVHPLPPGVHTLNFGGSTSTFSTDVTYIITVTPGH